MIAYMGSPKSQDFQAIPPGQPSPEITGYILQDGGYFAVKGSQEDMYIRDSNNVKLVDASAPDESSLYDRLNANIGSFYHNLGSDVSRYSGYVGTGFKDSINQLKVSAFDIGSWIKQAALVIIILLVLLLINRWV